MKALKLNPYLNFSSFEEKEITYWDNQNISRLTQDESKFLLRFVLNDGYQIQSAIESKEIEIIKNLIRKKVIGNFKIKMGEPSAKDKLISILNNLLPQCFFVFADNFLDIDMKNIIVFENKKILFLNFQSSTLVIGPCLKSSDAYEKYQETLTHTWTAKRWECSNETSVRAKIDYSLIELLIENISYLEIIFNEIDLQEKIITFEVQEGFKTHDIIFSLTTKLEVLNFKEEIDQYSNVFIENNGFRSKSTSEVLSEVKKYVGPITGLADVVDELFINGIPVYRAFSKLQYLMPSLYRNFYSMGKGADSELAYISAIAELIERFFAMINPINLPSHPGPMSAAYPYVKPEDLIMYSNSQFKSRDLKESNYFKRIPKKYNGETLQWICAENIFENKNYLVPKEVCVANNRLADVFFHVTSNGVAAGTSYVDAILQGMLECIERDAAAIWWYNQLERQQLQLDSIEMGIISRGIEWFEAQHKVFRVIEITSDFEIPCYAAVSYVATKKGSLKIGLGCHISSDIALSRAVTELIQAEGAQVFSRGEMIMDYSKYFENDNYELTFLNPPLRKIYRPKALVGFNLKKLYEELSEKLEKLNLLMLVINYTPEGSFFKVVRVIIPKLRTMMLELGPGRLYDVPVKMGFLENAKKENEINKHCLDV